MYTDFFNFCASVYIYSLYSFVYVPGMRCCDKDACTGCVGCDSIWTRECCCWWSGRGGEFGSLFMWTELGDGDEVAGDEFGTPKCKGLSDKRKKKKKTHARLEIVALYRSNFLLYVLALTLNATVWKMSNLTFLTTSRYYYSYLEISPNTTIEAFVTPR
jgi:hypothetical protein